MTVDDILRMSVAELIGLLASSRTAATADPWVDPKACDVAFREVLDAGRRGDCDLSKVGRRYLIRRSELDRWIATRRVKPEEKKTGPAEPVSRVAHILEAYGYTKPGGR
jgi:hypothetical protein